MQDDEIVLNLVVKASKNIIMITKIEPCDVCNLNHFYTQFISGPRKPGTNYYLSSSVFNKVNSVKTTKGKGHVF